MPEAKAKRKTHTSSEVKRRYNDKTYDRLTIMVRKEISKQYKDKCESLGITYSQPLHEAIQKFLNNSD